MVKKTPATPKQHEPPQKAKSRATAKTQAKRGRPSTYDSALADLICARVADGEPLRVICREENMPAWRTVYLWLTKHPDFHARFAHARELGQDAIAEDLLEIADDGSNDWMEKLDKEGNCVGYQLNGEHVQRSKLRIETRLKLLAKWNPKKYGEKVDVNHGGQAENPIAVLWKRVSGTALPVVKNPPSEGED